MFGLLKFIRIAAGTAKSIRDSNRMAALMAERPVAEFVPAWATMWAEAAGEIHPILRVPASRIEIVTAQARLGVDLPEELCQLYAQTDGFEWSAASEKPPFAGTDTVALAAAATPPLSACVREHWEKHGKDEDEPMGVRVFTSDFASQVADDHDKLIPFSDLDGMLLLEPWNDNAQATVMVVKPHKYFPVGTVLQVEGCHATRHGTLREGLASFAAAVTSVSRMGQRA